jgi:2-polyprenyl-3-methyl-5-hydroxy-6-metoxy-1,4-benzoquinol methylase
VLERYAAPEDVHLLECLTCGLQYFDPLEAGSDDFYSQLTSSVPSYYSVEKWDFRIALEHISTGQKTLDIACGAGEFVVRAQSAGALACGIDTNPSAVATARQRGLTAECLPLESFATRHAKSFDVVTAFQVIEHIPSVEPFVEAAQYCLKPGGKLIITVPNRLRRVRDPFEPLDCPPHHLSRWSSAQLQRLAAQAGLAVAAIRFEHADMHDCRAVIRQAVARRLGCRAEAGFIRAVGRLLFGEFAYRAYAATGMLDRWGLWRMSVMAVLRKPA